MFPNLKCVHYFEEIKEMYILSLQMKIISSFLCVSFYFTILICSSF